MDWVTVSVRFALYFDLTTLFGLPLFGLYALRREEMSSRIGPEAGAPGVANMAADT